MSSIIIDRRSSGKGKGKSSVNRQKFIRRSKKAIKESVKGVIRDADIKDITSNKKRKVNIPIKDMDEPTFHNGQGGVNERVLPGNDTNTKGDRIPRPEQGGGGGSGQGEASPDGEGEDEFHFHLTKDEFLDIFFEDLELPEMIKKTITKTTDHQYKRAGFTVDGSPSKLNITRTMRQAKSRRLGLRSSKRKKLKRLEEEQSKLQQYIKQAQNNGEDCSIEKERLAIVEEKIVVVKRQIKAVPFVDDMDLRYNRWEKVVLPSTQAVMFCILDVSGSMGEFEKEMAKRFFMLLYLFLNRNYEKVDIVFIRHHTIAKEVDEEEFFYSRESGGTIVSSSLQLVDEIIKERYPLEQWNIYCAQSSDGDNWSEDSRKTKEIMKSSILPNVQYFSYIEVNKSDRKTDLDSHYSELNEQFSNFAMAKVKDASEIYPVFRSLFEKKEQ